MASDANNSLFCCKWRTTQKQNGKRKLTLKTGPLSAPEWPPRVHHLFLCPNMAVQLNRKHNAIDGQQPFRRSALHTWPLRIITRRASESLRQREKDFRVDSANADPPSFLWTGVENENRLPVNVSCSRWSKPAEELPWQQPVNGRHWDALFDICLHWKIWPCWLTSWRGPPADKKRFFRSFCHQKLTKW